MLCIIIAFFLLATSVYGEVWKATDYDFSKIEKVMVFPVLIDQNVHEPLAFEKSTEFLTKFLQKERIFYVSWEEVLNKIIFVTGKNPFENPKLTEQEALFDFINQASEYVDGAIILEVLDCGYSEKLVSGFSIPRTTYETAYVRGNSSSGYFSGTVQYPKIEYIHVPPHVAQYSNAACSIRLFDLKNRNCIWAYSSQKSHRNRFISKLSALGVLKNIIAKGVSELPFSKSSKQKYH